MTSRLRRSPDRDDSGSMAFFLVLAIVGMAIAALLVPMIITSSQATRSDTSRTRALDAAQAGINVMIGEIRAAKAGDVGTSTKLPCSDRSGVVNSVGEPRYTVSVAYYSVDPVKATGAQPMTCVNGYGTYDPVSKSFTPKFARITSRGTDGTARSGSTPGRTLKATYVLRTTNSNIVGGPISIGRNVTLCMDAGAANPVAGAAITIEPCITPPTDRQIFAYRTDLTLQLISSISPTYQQGLCVDTADPPTQGQRAFLNPCSALGSPPPYTQQWSYGDPDGTFKASLPSSAATGDLADACLGVASRTANTPAVLVACRGTANREWLPSPATGAGMAQAPQLVNFFEFGRCLDVTFQEPDRDHLILYPCKQNPKPSAVTWNQKFTTPGIPAGRSSASGQITTTTPAGVTYCLTSPGTETGLVTTKPCTTTDARQVWTVYGAAASLSYAEKYTIVDSATVPRCLGLTEPRPDEPWPAIDVETCAGTSEQKWNAPADLTAAALRDVNEARP